MTVLTVKIEPPLSDHIQGLVEHGQYHTADEAVADLLGQSPDLEPETPEYVAWLKAELEKGAADIEAGRVVDFDMGEIWQEVERRLERR